MNLWGWFSTRISAFYRVSSGVPRYRNRSSWRPVRRQDSRAQRSKLRIRGLELLSPPLTTGEGTYTTPFLEPGRYSITASVSGFKTETKTNVELNVSDRQQIDFTMQVGGVSEQITVEASGQQIQSANADLGQTIGAAATAELPLLGRNPFQLTTLASGVQHTPALASRSDRPFDNGGMDSYNINGSRA